MNTHDQKKRRSQINELIAYRSKYYGVFFNDFSRMSSVERQKTRFGALPCLWNEFPERPSWDEHIGSAEDPGDGHVHSVEDIHLVAFILKALYEAWSNSSVQSSLAKSSTTPKVAKLTEMPKICLILYGMKQERLLDHFMKMGIIDKDLPLNRSTLKEIMPDEIEHANVFMTEQYRAVPRQWDDGAHIKVPQEEPLPLEQQHKYGSGSYGIVTRCQCKFTGKYYARKEQISPEARDHLKREVDRLRKLEHRHIVQFAKSYERGDTYGILLRPAATTDLKKLLFKRYAANHYSYVGNSESRVRDRTLLKPIILTSFGCLSRGLAQIHSRNIRHKDIKPENILYQKELPHQPPRFLWADFGLAHYFAQGDGSKTQTSMEHYSERYAAPESMQANLLAAHIQSVSEDHSYLQVQTAEMDRGSHEGSSDISKTDMPALVGRGRSADIFAFGCVFLETLSHLVDESRGKLDRAEFEICAPFHKHIDGLNRWAAEEMKQLKAESPLQLLFAIALDMIKKEPEARPKIHEIVERLRKADDLVYFCRKCQGGADEDRIVREKEVAEQQPLREQPSISDSIIKSQADPEVKESVLVDLALPDSSEALLETNGELEVEVEPSSEALRHPLAQPRRSALKRASTADPERRKSRPHFEDPEIDDEGP